MAEIDGGQLAARQLAAAGIDTIFGVVAGPMIEVIAGAARSADSGWSDCRHEESAGFMASAWGCVEAAARACCVVGSGPAVTNAVTPMHVATESAMPLVVLGGSTYGPTRGLGGFQEADQLAFARPGCKWTRRWTAPSAFPSSCTSPWPARSTAVPAPSTSTSRATWWRGASEEQAGAARQALPSWRAPHPDPDAIDRAADWLAAPSDRSC